MHRVSNEFVWATVVSIVCGIGLASLLSGSGLPLLLIVVVVAIGAGVAAYRRRGYATRSLNIRRLRAPRAERTPRTNRTTEPEPAIPRSQPRQPSPLIGESLSRRAGVRSRSLGKEPPSDRSRRPG